MPPPLARRTAGLGQALFRSVPGAELTLQGLEQALQQARAGPPLDPLFEQQILEGLRAQASQAQIQAASSRTGPATPALSASDLLAGQFALSRGLLAAESRRNRQWLQTFSAQQGVLGALAGVTAPAFRGGPSEALVQQQTAVRVARIEAEAQKASDFSRIAGAFIGAAGTVLGGPLGSSLFSSTAAAAAPPIAGAAPMPPAFLPFFRIPYRL